MKLLGAVIVCGFAGSALADPADPFSYQHAHPGPAQPAGLDPFAYAHGFPNGKRDYAGLGAGTVSPQEVAKFAPAPLDPAVSRHIQALLDVRGADAGAITAKGDRMFFTWKITGTAQVWRQDGPMKYPVQLTAGEDATSVAALAPNESFVVVSRDVGGEENPGLYLLSSDGGPLKLIQHTPKVQTSLAYISDDSRSIYYKANDREQASYAIYRYDVKTGTKELVFDQPGLWSVIDHRDDVWLLANELGNTQVEISSYDLAKKELVPLLGQNEAEEYQAAFGAKRGQLIVRTNKLGNFQRLYTYEAGVLQPLGADEAHDIEFFSIDHARSRIYAAVNAGGERELEVFDARTLKPIALPKLPIANLTTLTSLSPTGRFAQVALNGSATVPTTLVVDWQTRRTTEWRLPATPEIDATTFAKATLETYPARDGTLIPMYVRRPTACVNAATPCPVIVQFHGGPEGQARPEFSASAQAFVDAGFILVWPNVRGSTGYGKAWLHADDGAKRLAVITDIEDAARYMRTAWAVKGVAPKLGVNGGSYGGYSVLIAMTMFAGAYDAGAESVGISNLVTFLENTAPYRRILRTSEYGDPVRDRAVLEQLSPIHYVDRLRAPLLVFQGVNDPRVPVGEALQIHDAMERRNLAGGLILFPDEGHGSQKRSNIVLTLGHTIEFFAAYLK